jgi:hypothetical protein
MVDDLGGHIEHVQRIIAAGEIVFEGDPMGQAAMADFKAALGAIVQWGRGDRSKASLVELELLLRALLQRGTSGVYAALATQLEQLADIAPSKTASIVRRAAVASRALAHATHTGQVLPSELLADMAALRTELAHAAP